MDGGERNTQELGGLSVRSGLAVGCKVLLPGLSSLEKVNNHVSGSADDERVNYDAYLVGGSAGDELVRELSLVWGVGGLVVGGSLVRAFVEPTHCRCVFV